MSVCLVNHCKTFRETNKQKVHGLVLKEKQLPATKYNKLGLPLPIIKDSSVPKITGFGVNPKGIVLPQIPPIAFLRTSCWKPRGGISIIQSHLRPPVVGLGFSSPEEPKFLRTGRSPGRVSKQPNPLHLTQTSHIQGILVELKVPPSELAPFWICGGSWSLFYWQGFLSGHLTRGHNPFSEVYQQLITLPVQGTRLPGHQEKLAASTNHMNNSHKKVRGLHMKGDTDDKRERQVLMNKCFEILVKRNMAAFSSLWECY